MTVSKAAKIKQLIVIILLQQPVSIISISLYF